MPNTEEEDTAKFLAYDFMGDVKYSSGLQSIGQQDSLDTRWFYFERVILKRAFNISKQEFQRQHSDYPKISKLGFDDIMQLVKEGKEVPGIRQIPATTLGIDDSIKSVSKLQKKPWEI